MNLHCCVLLFTCSVYEMVEQIAAIVGGHRATEVPTFLLQSQYYGGQVHDGNYICGSGMFYPDWTVTAANCNPQLSGNGAYGGVAVVNGLQNAEDGPKLPYEEQIVHENAENSPTGRADDIALYKVSAASEKKALNICDANLDETEYKLLFSGFGQTTVTNTTYSVDLLVMEVPEEAPADVCKSTGGFSDGIDPIKQRCTTGVSKKPGVPVVSPCFGDEGAPVYAVSRYDPSNGPFCLYGIVSYFDIAVYLKLAPYVGWIKERLLNTTTPNTPMSTIFTTSSQTKEPNMTDLRTFDLGSTEGYVTEPDEATTRKTYTLAMLKISFLQSNAV
ncbi:uncharacterized protein LOC142345135 [Convolutriloba macropyga]|uniref:uncharacterized protein LOC142345135 n=1 Tax=Convolutriloba macropyga TaxID=536237 RepID=UPI003F51CB78